MGHAIIFLKIILADDLAPLEAVPVLAHQIFVGDDAAGRHLGRQQAGGAHLVDATPEIEMLEGALRQVLATRHVVHALAPLDQNGRHAPLGEINRQADPHRSAANDDDLSTLAHGISPNELTFVSC